MYAGRSEAIALPQTGHLHILKNGYVYWENDGKWDKTQKRMVDKRVSIGKLCDLSDRSKFYPNKTYWKLFPDGIHSGDASAERLQNTVLSTLNEPGDFSNRLNYGSFLVLKLAAEKIGMLPTLRKTHPESWEKIFALVTHYICEENSTAQKFPYWQFDNYSGMKNKFSDVEISRLYSNLGRDQNGIDSFMSFFRKAYEKSVYGREVSSSEAEGTLIAYALDSTNHNTNSRNNDLAEYGKAKIDEKLPQINFACFVDEQTSVPVYYELFFGSLLDKSQTPFTIKNATRLGFRKLFAVMDRGYFRKEVFDAFTGLYFACMCPENMPIFDEVFDKYASQIKDRLDYHIMSEDVYGIKIEDVHIYGRKYKAYLYYDAKRAEDERSTILIKLDLLKKAAKSRIKFTKAMVKKFSPWLIIEKLEQADPETGKKFKISVNTEQIQHELDKAGFFVVISNTNKTAEEIICAARKRDVDEKTFRCAKSHFDFTKTGTHNRNSYQGKMFVCFIALITSAAFCWYVKDYMKQINNRTTATVLGMMKKYQIQQQSDKSWFPVYCLTKNMKDILHYLGLSDPDTEVLQKIQEIKF